MRTTRPKPATPMSITASPTRTARIVSAILAALLVAGLFATAQATPAGADTLGAWSRTSSMSVGRYGHAAVKLPAGVLVTGGWGASHSVELFGPASGRWSTKATMKDARSEHTATLLPNGTVLVIGGYDSGALATAELYNPSTNTWTRTGSMTYARYDHTHDPPHQREGARRRWVWRHVRASDLRGLRPEHGNVRIGRVDELRPLTSTSRPALERRSSARHRDPGLLLEQLGHGSAEVYSRAATRWTIVGPMGVGRTYGATATPLSNGLVLISGGVHGDATGPPPLRSSSTQPRTPSRSPET